MYYFLTYKYMDRIIKFDDLKKVVEEAYEAQKIMRPDSPIRLLPT